MKNYLYLVPVRACSLELAERMEVFYVYETTKKGLLLQKHGLTKGGAPFQTRHQAIDWIKKQLISGRYIFKKK